MTSRVADARSLIVGDAGTSAARPRREAASDLTGVEARVRALFLSSLELDVEADVDVIDSGVLDSIAFVQLLVELEQEFEITVSMGALDLDDFRSVRTIARFVERARADP